MKKSFRIALVALVCLSPMGMQAQSVDFSQYEETQIINSDFEDWSGKDFKNVPVGWHSFESVGGTYAFAANSTEHTSKNTEGLHDGTIGKSCLKLMPRNVYNVIANGTITTGRMNAGALFATSTKNHAWMDISNTDTSNGSPFYALLSERPVALSVWVKFTQGTAQSNYPYATVSAAITNGKRYQEPTANNDSSVVIGYAKNNTISTNGGQWQHLYVPFRYDSGNFNKTDAPKAIMVTFSTNADPGQGSVGDVLLIDDLELVYTQTVTIPDCGYATLTNVSMKNHKVVIPEGITAYTLEANADGELLVKDTYKAGQVLPYNAAVLLEGAPGTYEFQTTLYDKEESVVAEGDFCLVKGKEFNTPVAGYKYYHLSQQNYILGFYPVSNGQKIKDWEALLRVKESVAAKDYQNVLYEPKLAGDVNSDGILNIADVTTIVNRLLGKSTTTKFFIPNADINNDNTINISDVSELVKILLNN